MNHADEDVWPACVFGSVSLLRTIFTSANCPGSYKVKWDLFSKLKAPQRAGGGGGAGGGGVERERYFINTSHKIGQCLHPVQEGLMQFALCNEFHSLQTKG